MTALAALLHRERLACAIDYQRALAVRDKAGMSRAVAELKALDSDCPLELQNTREERS